MTMSKAEGDRIAWAVLWLMRDVRDAVKEDRFAPVDALSIGTEEDAE